MSYNKLDKFISEVIPYKLRYITTEYAMKYYNNGPEYILGVYIFYRSYKSNINIYIIFFAGDGRCSSIHFANEIKSSINLAIDDVLRDNFSFYTIYTLCSKWNIDECYLVDKCKQLDHKGILILRRFSMTESIIWIEDGRAI